MHPYLAEAFSTLDDSRGRLLAAVDAIPQALRTKRAAPDRWSATEILEHLALVETRFAGMLAAAVDQALQAGLPPESGTRLPLPAPVGQRMADRVNKRSAPEPVVPTGSLDEAAARAAADTARATLRNAVQRADGLALSRVTCAHPFFGELTAYQWMELMSGHERRHVEQIDELRAALTAAST